MGEATLTTEGPVARLTFSNPPQGLMDEAMEAALLDAVQRVEADPELRVCVLTGGDPGVFIRHYDVAVLARRAEKMAARGLTFSEGRPVPESPIHEAMRRMEQGRAVYVAALNGTAMGGGFELALACDLRVVQTGPHRFGLPEINLGILPGAGGTQRLVRLLGQARAQRMILLGETLGPEELAETGLAELSRDAPAASRELAARLAAKPARALAHCKRLTRTAPLAEPDAALALERTLFCDLMVTDDARRLMAQAAAGERDITDPPEG